MIILHGAVQQEQFWLWGEQSAGETGKAKKAAARPRNAAALPYDAGVTLAATLAEVLPFTTIAKPQTAVVWLPAIAGAPVPSSFLLGEAPDAKAKISLAAWTVTALPLDNPAMVELLCACAGAETLAPGVVIGPDLAYWAAALHFGGALVARERFLPGVKFVDGKCYARWEPVIAGADAALSVKLAQAMPAACRAMEASASAAPPAVAAQTVLTAFLGMATDELVRSSAAPPAAFRARGKVAFDSLHDQWLHALRTDDDALNGKESELQQLITQVREWQRPITAVAATPFRLCFRLEEPLDEAEATTRKAAKNGWQVSYLLQDVAEQSLLLPLKDVWQPKASIAKLLQRGSFQPREYLLSSLGQASSFNPQIETSLKSAAPDGYGLDAAGAHQFLTEQAWLLEQAGFGVLLPAWWSRKGSKLKLTARANVKGPKLQGGGGLTLESLVQFDYQIALGDQTLTLKELETLAKLKAPLVKWRGQWVQLNADEIQAALAFWQKKAEGRATVREVVQMALGGRDAVKGLAFDGVNASDVLGDLLAQLQGSRQFSEQAVPTAFHGTLRPYQVRGYSWLTFLKQWGLGACLADDMGLGKTIQALTLLQAERQQGEQRPVLLVCPMSVIGNWKKEAERFTPDLPVMVHHGLTRAKGAAFKKEAGQQAVVLSSYALLHRDFEVLKNVDWAGVILDEAQNIKNAETKQAKAARALEADYRIALTGTPVENNVGDLWSLMEFLNPGFLGTQAEFKRNFFVPIQAQRDADASAQLKRLTSPFILRRLKTDKAIIADLPDKLEMKVFCTLTKEQASLYAAVVNDLSKGIEKAEGIQRKGLVLATLIKLKQVCNHPAHFLGDNSALPARSGKLARLTEMLEEVFAAGERALVFTQFAEMGGMLQRHLQATFGREALFLHGGVVKKNRDRLVERFQAADEHGPRVFILSLKAGGTGLNLTAANHVFHFDRWWNPAVENQATDRAFRIGQTRNVQVHKFLCAGTLEERIDEMIERKSEIAASIVGTGEGWLTELSNDALRELLTLRADAVGE